MVVQGSGPSLTQDQVDYCRGKARFIAINDGYQLAPWADILYACDYRWWKWHDGAASFEGTKVTTDENAAKKYGVTWIQGVRKPGISPSVERIHYGNHGGHQAVNIAALTGTKRIILIGMDHTFKKKTHFFGDHPTGKTYEAEYYKTWFPNWQIIKNDAEKMRIEIINASRETALDMFSRVKLEECI